MKYIFIYVWPSDLRKGLVSLGQAHSDIVCPLMGSGFMKTNIKDKGH